MDHKEKVIIVLPGDKVSLVASRPVRIFYRVEEITEEERTIELVL